MAKFALEWTFTGVRPVVPHQSGRDGKRFLTNIALIRIGRSGLPLPIHQPLGTRTTFTFTDRLLLLLLFGVRFHVTGMGTFATEIDVALLAAELCTDHRGRLLLRGQTGRHRPIASGLVEVAVRYRLAIAVAQVDHLLLEPLL